MNDEDLPQVSFADVVCGMCRSDILAHGWGPAYQGHAQGRPECPDCQELIQRQFARVGDRFRSAMWLDLPDTASSREKSVRHEAAHAVAVERTGLLLHSATVCQKQIEVGGSPMSGGGNVHFDLPGGQAPLGDVVQVLHAGWASDRLWLTEHGLGDDLAFTLDAAQGAIADMDALSQWVTDPQIHVTGKHDADALVREHDREIRAVADELARHGHLGGDAIRAAMHEVTRSSRARAATQHQQQSRNDSGTPAPPAGVASTTTSSASSSGGHGMGIDEIAAAIGNAQQTSEQIRSALAQIQQWSEDTTGQLGAVLQGSSQPEVQQSVQAFAQIAQQAGEIHQLVAGAVEGLESYRNRL